MRRRSLILVVCFFYALLRIQAQDYRILHWGVEHGLSQGINQKIIQDARGFLWISSYEGVNRFDGKTFTNFYSYPVKRNSIKGTETTGLVEDSLHNIWIGSGEGLNRYDPVADSVITLHITSATNSRVQYIVPVAASDSEVICFEFGGRIVAFHIRHFTQRIVATGIPWYDDYVNVNNSWFDKKHQTLWMPADKGMVQVNIVNGQTVRHFPTEQVNAIAFRNRDSTLIAGTDRCILICQLGNNTISSHNVIRPPKGVKFTSLCYDNQENLWAGTEEQGLYIMRHGWNPDHLVKTDNPLYSISANKINTIFCDRSGMIWLGVATNGIDQLIPGNRFTHYAERPQTPQSLNNNIVRCFVEDNDQHIWIATQGGGINIFDPLTETFTALTRSNLPGLPFDFIRFMVKDDTHMLVGTEKGMCRINPTDRRVQRIQFTGAGHALLPDPYIEQIVAFTNNSWLIATKEYGLFTLSKQSNTAQQCAYPGNKHVFYTAFVNGHLFVSVWDTDPVIFNITDTGWQPVKKDLTSFLVTYVLYDTAQKKYWIGTLKGLLETDDHLRIIRQYTTDDGLSNNYIYAMVQDAEGLLWLSTNKGLSVFDRRTKTFRVFTPADGLQGYEYNAKACLMTSYGTLYFGGTNGFDRVHRPATVLPGEPARLYIKQFLVNNVPPATGSNINYAQQVHLPWSGNNISIQTGMIHFMTGDNRIRYKLEGADADWKTADRDFVINYSGLSPGTYTFLATAAGNDLTNKKPITRLVIVIASPWWQSWWLRLALIALVSGGVVLIIRSYYQRKLERQRLLFEKQRAVENERTRIATDMHDDLGAGLSRIKFLSETIDIKKQTRQPIEEDIGKIKAYSHEMISKMGEIVWALNEKNDSIHDLAAYIRAYTVEYLSEHDIACTATIPDTLPEIFVSGEFRRNIFLSVKEALHNIVKHAGATAVTLSLSVNGNLLVTIQDNGKGFNAAGIRPFSNGISNMNARIKSIGGSVTIQPSAGTLVQIRAPLPV